MGTRRSGARKARGLATGWGLTLTGVWLLCVGLGMGMLWRHSVTPSPGAQAPTDWPESSSLVAFPTRPNLLMWCHPRCPCTRASLEELQQFIRRTDGRVAVQVLFLQPPGYSSDWVQGELWTQAEQISGVQVVVDKGHEARAFGVRTSGQVLLFDPQRRLRFSGGLTAARGHLGDNSGLDAAVEAARGGTVGVRQSPVYGCSLFNPSSSDAAVGEERRTDRSERDGQG